MKRPFFSIIIPTYNSEQTLGYTLKSIQRQSIKQDEVEVLVIDGGSTDSTKEIAKKYNVIVYENPKRLPEHAKAIGTSNAMGHYVIRMDSDEEFSYKTQLQDKMDFLVKYPEVKVLLTNKIVSGRKNICGISADYMNTFGDPFSYFVYNTKDDKYETYHKNIIKKNGRNIVLKFESYDIYPLADSAASALSLDYIREQYPNEYDTIEFVCKAYDQIIQDTMLCGCIKGDNIRHNCRSSFRIYISKLKFRVVNNIFHKAESGFSSKERFNGELRKRKTLFCIYALFVPWPIMDSIRLAIKYKNPTYLLHFIYVYYVCIQIAIFGVVKLAGGQRNNNVYGK